MTLTPTDLAELRAHIEQSAEALSDTQAALMRERATVGALRAEVAALRRREVELVAVVELQADALSAQEDR